MKNDTQFITEVPGDLSPHLKGIYARVAVRLGVDLSFVAGAAQGEFQSKVVEQALEQDLRRILDDIRDAQQERAVRKRLPAGRRQQPLPRGSNRVSGPNLRKVLSIQSTQASGLAGD